MTDVGGARGSRGHTVDEHAVGAARETSPSNYFEQLRWLYGLRWQGMKLGLERMRMALRLRGEPHGRLPVVHLAGTNGKGSVAAMVESAARHAGLRTGLFTSPHLHRFTERIRIEGKPAGEAHLSERLETIRQWLEHDPDAPALTFFEVSTLLAIETFAEAEVDLAIFEAGLGGRFDATNVFPRPLATAVVSVGLDHTHLLGDTLAQIAWEKAGIARPEVPLISGPLPEEAAAALEKTARERGALPWRLGREIHCRALPDGTWRIEAPAGAIEGLYPPLPGAHQRDNLAVAAAILLALRRGGLPLPPDAVRRGIAATRWPGRLERIPRQGAPDVLLDVAHNPDGCAALARHLADAPRPRTLIFGAMRDKDHRRMLARLRPHHEHLLLVAPRDLPRAAPPEHIAEYAPGGRPLASVAEALTLGTSLSGPDGLIVVAGSLFVVAEARTALLQVPTDPPVAL